MPATILIVDDEPAILDSLEYALRTEGFVVVRAGLGQAALDRLAGGAIDLLVLDVGLPDLNGFDVCRALRRFSDVPVLFLTARSDEIDRILGLELGGDDYVAKPFSPRELVSRVRAILRRGRTRAPAAIPPPVPLSSGSGPGSAGTLAADSSPAASAAAQRRYRHDREGQRIAYLDAWLPLTRYEYGLLAALLERPGLILSRARLMERVWSDSTEALERTVDAHVKTLRAKLREAGAGDPIETHRGMGYSLRRDAA